VGFVAHGHRRSVPVARWELAQLVRTGKAAADAGLMAHRSGTQSLKDHESDTNTLHKSRMRRMLPLPYHTFFLLRKPMNLDLIEHATEKRGKEGLIFHRKADALSWKGTGRIGVDSRDRFCLVD